MKDRKRKISKGEIGCLVGRGPFEGYEEITKREELKLRRMSIEESVRLTEVLLKEARLWMR